MSIQMEQAKSKGIKLKVKYLNISENLDSSQESLNGNKELFSPVMKSDAGRIQQVLLNLLSNALKFTSKGSIKIIVEITNGLFGE